MEVFPGACVGLHLHNLLPGLASRISEEISVELENLRTEHVYLVLHLIPSLVSHVNMGFGCGDQASLASISSGCCHGGLDRIISFCLLGFLALVSRDLACLA